MSIFYSIVNKVWPRLPFDIKRIKRPLYPILKSLCDSPYIVIRHIDILRCRKYIRQLVIYVCQLCFYLRDEYFRRDGCNGHLAGFSSTYSCEHLRVFAGCRNIGEYGERSAYEFHATNQFIRPPVNIHPIYLYRINIKGIDTAIVS